MGIQKTILVVFVVALIAVAIIGVTAVTSGNNLSLKSGISKHIEDKSETHDKEDNIPSNFSAKITIEQAQEIALKNVAGTIKDSKLEDENGNIVYNIDIVKDNTETEVKIDPSNGNVLKTQNDNNDKKDDTEKKDNIDYKDNNNQKDSGENESD